VGFTLVLKILLRLIYTMASQNIIETINTNEHKIEIYQDAASKFRWRALTNNTENVGSSEQGFKTLELCKQNLQSLSEVIGATMTNKIRQNDLRATKVEVMSSSENAFENEDELTGSEEQRAMDWNIFWLVIIILLLSLFIFARVFLFR
jgi:uncharacterized protein YegP (UPF0339 family)